MAVVARTPRPMIVQEEPYTVAPPVGGPESVPAYTGLMGAPNPSGSIYMNRAPAAISATATTRAVDPNELAGTQLTGLIRGDSDYMRANAALGAQTAAARGSVAGNYYAGAARTAALQAAMPIALQQAGQYGQVGSENMQAQNAASLENARNSTSFGIAEMGQEGDMARAELAAQLEREQGALGRNLTRDQLTQAAALEREGFGNQRWLQESSQGFQRGENALDRTFQRGMAADNFRRQAAAGAMQTVFNNPEYMRDPAGASGLVNFWTRNVDTLFPPIDGGG